MKHLFVALSLLLGLAAVPAADAQPAGEASYDQWTPRQWRGLERQLTQTLQADIAQLDPVILQNVIFFETRYPDAMALERLAPRLYDLYVQHPNPAMRMLALTGLGAIGEPDTMARLARRVRFDASAEVRHVGIATVSDYHRRRAGR